MINLNGFLTQSKKKHGGNNKLPNLKLSQRITADKGSLSMRVNMNSEFLLDTLGVKAGDLIDILYNEIDDVWAIRKGGSCKIKRISNFRVAIDYSITGGAKHFPKNIDLHIIEESIKKDDHAMTFKVSKHENRTSTALAETIK